MPPNPKAVRYNKNGQPRKPYTRKKIVVPTVEDPTDPGTLRPDDPPEVIPGEHFDQKSFPCFHSENLLPSDIDSSDPLPLFSLFWTSEVLVQLVHNINESARIRSSDDDSDDDTPTYARFKRWTDIAVSDFLIWLSIYIYMGMHPENDRKNY